MAEENDMSGTDSKKNDSKQSALYHKESYDNFVTLAAILGLMAVVSVGIYLEAPPIQQKIDHEVTVLARKQIQEKLLPPEHPFMKQIEGAAKTGLPGTAITYNFNNTVTIDPHELAVQVGQKIGEPDARLKAFGATSTVFSLLTGGAALYHRRKVKLAEQNPG